MGGWEVVLGLSLGPMGTWESEGRRDPQMGPWGPPTLEEDPVKSPGKERAAGKTNSLGEEQPRSQGKRCGQAHQM